MFNLLYSDFYKIVRSKTFIINLMLCILFVQGRAINFDYEFVRITMEVSRSEMPSIYDLIAYVFKDNSILLPVLWFVLFFMSKDLSNGSIDMLVSKGIRRKDIYLSKLIACCITVFSIIIISITILLLTVSFFWEIYDIVNANSLNILLFLILQIILYLGYTCVIVMVCFISNNSNISFVVNHGVAIILYWYLEKLSHALDLKYSLANYWVLGISNYITCDNIHEYIFITITTVLAYTIITTLIGIKRFESLDLK